MASDVYCRVVFLSGWISCASRNILCRWSVRVTRTLTASLT